MLVPIEEIKMICFKKNVLAYDLLKLLKPRHFCSFPNQTLCMFPSLQEYFQFCSVVFVVVLAVGYSGDKLFFLFLHSGHTHFCYRRKFKMFMGFLFAW